MKKQILIGLISIGSILTVNAQTWTGSSDVNGNLWRNGNVGVGIANPLTPLHISTSNTTETNILTLQNVGAWGNCQLHNIIWKDQGNAITGAIGLQYGTDGNVDFKIHSLYNGGYKTSSFVSFVVKGNGNVGIGTTSPSDKLSVVGSINLSRSLENNDWTALKIVNSGSWSTAINKYSQLLFTDGQGNVAGIGATYNGGYGRLDFNALYNNGYGSTSSVAMSILGTGNVGIGTISPAYKLDVCGTIRAKEVIVDLNGTCAPDFVFKSDYKLMNLKDLEVFVKTNQHLPEIASEKEMIENGVNMKELQMKLLQKMEEMTLYIIDQNKKIETIEEQNKLLKQEIELLKTK